MTTIADNYRRLQERMRRAAELAGRRPEEVRLVAVSKTIAPDRIRAAHAAGIHCFGENRAQELREKSAALDDLPIEWHFVGHLQTNKVRYVVPNCALIHSVDRFDLARKISGRAAPDAPQRVLVQVNTTSEESKSGIDPAGLPALLDQMSALPNLIVEGLMTIGPLTSDRELIVPAFRNLRGLRERERAVGRPRMPLRHLSMGMSGDYELAIAEGATLVRVGTAIFGSRGL